RDALDADGSAGDAGRAQYLRERGLGGIPGLSHPARNPTPVPASPPRRRASVLYGRLSGQQVTPKRIVRVDFSLSLEDYQSALHYMKPTRAKRNRAQRVYAWSLG